MGIGKICVIGAGTMGNGIAQVSAQAGYETRMADVNQGIIDRGMNTIKGNLDRQIKKGVLKQEDVAKILARLHTSTSLRESAKDADFVIEAVFEHAELKTSVFRELDEVCPKETILASNTSSIPIALLSSATKRPDRVVGAHFFSPAPVMRGAEVVRALLTSEETVKATFELLKSFGKEPVVVKDSPGFVANRFCMVIFNEGAKVLEEGLSSLEEIDKLMRLSLNWPMGPFELADLVGIDIVVDTLEGIYRETGWERYKPAPLLKRMVDIGYLGRKAGKGFYTLFGEK